MRSVKFLIAAGAASLLSSAAFAADMPIAPPPDVRAAAGRGFRRLVSARRHRLQQSARQDRLEQRARSQQRCSLDRRHCGFDTAGIFGLGVGYQFNNWFRADVTGAVSRQLQFPRHRHVITDPAVPASAPTTTPAPSPSGCSGQRLCRSRHLVVRDAVHRRRRRHRASRSRTSPITASRNSGRRRVCRASPTRDDASSGISPGRCMPVSPTRSRRTSRSNSPISYVEPRRRHDRRPPTFDGTNARHNPMTFKNITSHDLKLGVRWNLDSPPVYAPPPLIRKG